MITLQVFVGYQFRSLTLSRTTLLSRIVEAVERLELDVNNVHNNSLRLKIERLDLLSALAMGTQILETIDRADICLFESSELNANVLFEMGYAEGKGKRSIYLVHESINLSDLPSDIRQDYVKQYREDRLDIKAGEQLKLVFEQMHPDLSVNG